jgi:hypothetical protein
MNCSIAKTLEVIGERWTLLIIRDGLVGVWPIGGLGTSALVEYAPAPTHLIWGLVLGASLLGAAGILAIPETSPSHPMYWRRSDRAWASRPIRAPHSRKQHPS